MAVYYIINDVELHSDFIRKCLLYGINTENMRLLLGSYGIWRSFFVSHDRKILLFVCFMVFNATFNKHTKYNFSRNQETLTETAILEIN
jgi:hypothetical protein